MRQTIFAMGLLLTLNILIGHAMAIDTNDWEMPLGVQFAMAKPGKAWMLGTAQLILKDAFPGKATDYFDRFYDEKAKDINIPVPNAWHDITHLQIMHTLTQRGDLYVVVYNFKKGTITVADVISRYGLSLAKVTTTNKLEKEITYILEPYDKDLIIKSNLWLLTPNNDYQGTMLIFKSKDKLFIDELTAMTEITDLNRPDEKVEKNMQSDKWWEREDLLK
jgi:hypothetical protein